MRPLASRIGREPVGAIGLVGTALVHGTAAALVLLLARPAAMTPLLPAYRVELVAAPRGGGSPEPPAAAAPPAAEPSAPAPAPARRPPPAAERSPSPAPTRTPAPRAPAPSPSAARAPAAAAEAPAGAGVPTGAVGGTGSDPATIRTEGVEFPFPGYLRNLVAQVFRRWRPPGGDAELEAEVMFLVRRDGSITDLRFVRRSGSFGFDLEAQGAVEAAARAGAFGPLPAGYGPDVLPVSFFFSPRSQP